MRGTQRTKAKAFPVGKATEEEEEFEPLFSYAKHAPIVIDDDEDEEELPIPKKWQRCSKKPRQENVCITKPSAPAAQPKPVVLEDDWLSPPPIPVALPNPVLSDITLSKLRQTKEKLLHIASNPPPPVPKTAAAQATKPSSTNPSSNTVPVQANSSKEKIRIFLQDKNGNRKQYALLKTDKLEKLFSAYASFVKLQVDDLVFRFDGDQLSAKSTPKELDMEDEDQIEVFHKPSPK